jgi:hypothetical protein
MTALLEKPLYTFSDGCCSARLFNDASAIFAINLPACCIALYTMESTTARHPSNDQSQH